MTDSLQCSTNARKCLRDRNVLNRSALNLCYTPLDFRSPRFLDFRIFVEAGKQALSKRRTLARSQRQCLRLKPFQ